MNENQTQEIKERGMGSGTKRRELAGGRNRSEATARDIEIVGWLGRHRLATASQVMRRFGMQRSKAYQRLGRLVDLGLARHEPGIRSARVYLATRKGLAVAQV